MTDQQDMGGRAAGTGPVPDPDSVREEAEKLVATGLAAVSMVADRIGAPTRERGGSVAASYDAIGDMLFGPSGHRRHSVANDSPECCRCPLCRAISAAREPNPEVAERLASGVGDLAEGAARMLRSVANVAGSAWDMRPDAPTASATRVVSEEEEDDPWAAATRPVPKQPVAKKTVAKKTVAKKAVAKKAVKPTAVEPAAVEPAAVEPAVVEPAVVEPAPVESTVVEQTVTEQRVVVEQPVVDDAETRSTGEADQ